MSYITEAVVWLDSAGKDIQKALAEPLPFDVERGQSFGHLDMDPAGGSKWFTSEVYAAAFNYVEGDDLEDWFRALPWSTYDRATLLWSTEGSYEGSVKIGAAVADGWP